MNFARIAAIEYALPENRLDNARLAAELPDWDVAKAEIKTGIRSRGVVGEHETALDLAEVAGRALIDSGAVTADAIDALVFCTQSPDFILPPNSPMLQARLGIPKSVQAFDITHGCSGFLYSLSIGKALIESGQAKTVLLITSETYSRHINKKDKSNRSLFGDAAAATLLRAEDADRPFLDHFRFYTDGEGARNLVVPTSGARRAAVLAHGGYDKNLKDGLRTIDDLYMAGLEIFTRSMIVLPKLFNAVLEDAGLDLDHLDAVLFHQASGLVLENLRKKCKIPEDKYIIHFAESGNTVSSTIPIALKQAIDLGEVRSGQTMIIAGFGVGYSGGAAFVRL
ncbi:3-oxoacyl-ACP synthase [Alphaproteobacteria bacterium]|nr:3-oxoacyl-ACP synthase [Alphaproteobacteria bacterium]